MREGAAQAPWITEEACVSEQECECVKVGEQTCECVCGPLRKENQTHSIN